MTSPFKKPAMKRKYINISMLLKKKGIIQKVESGEETKSSQTVK